METAQLVAIATVVCVWAVAVLTIRRWGPGRARRSVRCPEKNRRARLEVEQREGEFGRLRVADVTACSLLPAARVDCGKECLARF